MTEPTITPGTPEFVPDPQYEEIVRVHLPALRAAIYKEYFARSGVAAIVSDRVRAVNHGGGQSIRFRPMSAATIDRLLRVPSGTTRRGFWGRIVLFRLY